MIEAPGICIIAEAGVNHNGSVEMAKELARAAVEAGADVVKFQTFDPTSLVTAAAPTAGYQEECGYQDQREMLASLQLPVDRLCELRAYCISIGIEFLSTAFDLRSFAVLQTLGQQTWKIPSGEITNVPLIEAIAAAAKEVILSTGMATLGEIEQALGWLEAAGCVKEHIAVLHCGTAYPLPFDEVNLRAMQTIAGAFGVRVGYSDHTLGIEVPIAAAALGAVVIEKHFTLDSTLVGPDHKASLEPAELKRMVRAIRNVERALGDSKKTVSSSERKYIGVVRKSIVAARDIGEGERLDATNITTKRPGTGVSAAHWHTMVGRVARRRYREDDLIEW